MFTGIIEKKVKFKEVSKSKYDLTICAKLNELHNSKIGDSIAVNGVCLTISKIESEYAFFDLMHETLDRTTFKDFSNIENCNIEFSLTMNKKLDGHIVYGEVDCRGKIIEIKSKGNSLIYTFSYPEKYNKYLIDKGRITIDGASLSVINSETPGRFSVSLIPHTLKVITIGEKSINNFVNLEFDTYAKIIYKQKGL